MTSSPARPRKKKNLARSQARLGAVQALYQMDMAQTDLAAVIEEFKTHRLSDNGGQEATLDADHEHFTRVLNGVVRRQRDIDPLIDCQLAAGWRLVRIDSIVRAILRAGLFELMELTDIPPSVVISEYVEVTNAFFEGEEPKVVNGVLDALARKLRPSELPER
ncbi:MAG TPA: transcription antitermination factor NusB [Hyphomicrobiaceae bacterium]|jgi:N utilization substance protein B|nr:transcription antitermination factor NusB [Hyphomicrobiaceae bacterium]